MVVLTFLSPPASFYLKVEGCSLNNHAKRVCHANSYDNNVTRTVSVVVVAMILQQMGCRINILH